MQPIRRYDQLSVMAQPMQAAHCFDRNNQFGAELHCPSYQIKLIGGTFVANH